MGVIYYVIDKMDYVVLEFDTAESVGAFILGRSIKKYIVVKSTNEGDRVIPIVANVSETIRMLEEG